MASQILPARWQRYSGATVAGASSEVRGKIAFAMLFENRGGKVGYRIVRNFQTAQTIETPELSSVAAGVQRELARALTAAGLYPKEAAAMIGHVARFVV